MGSDRSVIIDAPAFNKEIFFAGENSDVDFGGFFGMFAFVDQDDRYQFRYQLPHIAFKNSASEFKISNIEGSLFFHESPAGLLLYDAVGSIGTLSLKDSVTSKAYFMADFDTITETSVTKGDLSGSSGIIIDQIHTPTEKFGPAQLLFTMSGFNDKALYSLQNNIQEIYLKFRDKPEQMNKRIAKYAGTQGWKIMANTPTSIKFETEIALSQGELKFDFALKVDPLNAVHIKRNTFLDQIYFDSHLEVSEGVLLEALKFQEYKTQSQIYLLEHDISEDDLRLDDIAYLEALSLKQAKNTVDGFVHQGYFIEKEGNLFASAAFSSKSITVNGEDLPALQSILPGIVGQLKQQVTDTDG